MKVNHSGRFTFIGNSALLLCDAIDSAMFPAQRLIVRYYVMRSSQREVVLLGTNSADHSSSFKTYHPKKPLQIRPFLRLYC